MLIAFENNIRLDMLVCLRSSYRSPFPLSPAPCWGMRCFWLLAAVTARLVDCSTARPLQNGVYLMDCIDKRDNFIEYRDTKRARQLPLICDPSNCSSILSNCLAQLCWFIVSIRVRDRLLDLDLDLSSERSISPLLTLLMLFSYFALLYDIVIGIASAALICVRRAEISHRRRSRWDSTISNHYQALPSPHLIAPS